MQTEEIRRILLPHFANDGVGRGPIFSLMAGRCGALRAQSQVEGYPNSANRADLLYGKAAVGAAARLTKGVCLKKMILRDTVCDIRVNDYGLMGSCGACHAE